MAKVNRIGVIRDMSYRPYELMKARSIEACLVRIVMCYYPLRIFAEGSFSMLIGTIWNWSGNKIPLGRTGKVLSIHTLQ